MGGSARRAILFEGPPGTGKTYMAKAMAAEGGVPFLFVSSSAFQSMFYGQTNRKIRSFFRDCASTPVAEGGAIGFIEEIDAIGGARGGLGMAAASRRRRRRGERVAHPAPVLRPAPGATRMAGALIELVNRWLPAGRALRKPRPRRPTSSSSARPTAPRTSTRRWCGPGASTGPSTSGCRAERAATRSSTTTWTKKAHDAGARRLGSRTRWPP